jgi:hypothetical protein
VIQKFASAFFQSYNKSNICSKLNVFVYGMHGDPTAEEVRELSDGQLGEDESITRVRQHYLLGTSKSYVGRQPLLLFPSPECS